VARHWDYTGVVYPLAQSLYNAYRHEPVPSSSVTSLRQSSKSSSSVIRRDPEIPQETVQTEAIRAPFLSLLEETSEAMSLWEGQFVALRIMLLS
jgi:hypothetical protein